MTDRQGHGLRGVGLAGMTLTTILELLRYLHRAGVYFPESRRWADLNEPLNEHAPRRHRRLARLTLRCRDYGSFGELQVRLPISWWRAALRNAPMKTPA